jgi:hypothetical protein
MTTFTVEDGTGLEDSTSYVDVAFSEDYLGSSWAADDTAKQNALIAATEYADARWGEKIKSRPLVETQALEFPRYQLYDRYGNLIEDAIPDDWKKAICLYAQASVAGTLYPTPSTSSSKDLKRKKTVVGPITTEVEYQGSATDATWLKFPLADRLVKQFIYGAGGGVMRN